VKEGQPDTDTAVGWLKTLTDWLESDYEALVHAKREGGLHASGLPRACGRRVVLSTLFGAKDVAPKAGNHLTFGMGHALHWWWQHRYLGPKQELWGDWKCIGCNTTVRGFMPLKCPCGASWLDAMKYVELEVRDSHLKFVGHTDGIIVSKSGLKRVFEFKTIGPDKYEELQKPKPDHVIQAHAYMHCLGINEALILYQDKGKQTKWRRERDGSFTAAEVRVKPFIVKFDDGLWKTVVERVGGYHKAAAFVANLSKENRHPTEEEVVAFERVCPDAKCDLALECPVARQCFLLGPELKTV
jgi:hypothetical protein